jgi:hypothetical protein
VLGEPAQSSGDAESVGASASGGQPDDPGNRYSMAVSMGHPTAGAASYRWLVPQAGEGDRLTLPSTIAGRSGSKATAGPGVTCAGYELPRRPAVGYDLSTLGVRSHMCSYEHWGFGAQGLLGQRLPHHFRP